jgi:exodeoxyribonuclease VII small subunit
MVKRKSVKDEEGWSYEEKVAQIEGIIARIERGELELNEVFDEFTTAVEFLRECEVFLQSSVERVDLLIESLQLDEI